ncbi:MAG TPA: DUF4142 domain-containing protein [Myxococcales bacterium]|nr:DUF4142 domain-containing protein [Myxococcales bacterium]
MMLVAMMLAAASPTMTDAQLATQIHNINKMEIDVGKLGEKDCQSAQCKELARMIRTDHEQADKKVTGIVKPDESSLPQEITEQNKTDHANVDQLKKMKGAEFDKTFGQMMVQGHQDAIQMLKDNQSNIQNQQLKSFVAETLPKLQQHEDMARKVMNGQPAAQGRAPENTPR